MNKIIVFTGLIGIAFLFSNAETNATVLFNEHQHVAQQQLQWRYDPPSQRKGHNREQYSYTKGYEEGYGNGYDEGYAAGLKQAKKDRKNRKKRKQKRKERKNISGWDIPPQKAAGQANCHPYTFKVRGGKGSAQISTINPNKGIDTISLKPGAKRGVKHGYVCFEQPTRLILSRYEGENTSITLKIDSIGKFTFTGREPGWKGHNGWRTLRSAYWLLDGYSHGSAALPHDTGWKKERYRVYNK